MFELLVGGNLHIFEILPVQIHVGFPGGYFFGMCTWIYIYPRFAFLIKTVKVGLLKVEIPLVKMTH